MPEFCTMELARRLEAAHAWRGVEYAHAQAILHPDWRAAAEAIGSGFAIYAGPDSPVNWVIGAGLRGPVRANDWKRMHEFYGVRGEQARFALCPLADRSLLDLLHCHCYRLTGFLNVLACVLPDQVVSLPWPGGVAVNRADPGDAELWIRTTAQGFAGTDTPTREDMDILAPNFQAANALPFLALVDGQPAGGGSILVHEGVAEFGGDSTRLAYRRRGVHMALLQARLAAARELGCDLALLLAEPGSGSQRDAERVGFRVAYTNALLMPA
jgi:GNAT superfamily N-acetyltransferase